LGRKWLVQLESSKVADFDLVIWQVCAERDNGGPKFAQGPIGRFEYAEALIPTWSCGQGLGIVASL
jgi:hypothetical protein